MRIKTEIDGEGLDKQWAQRYILDPLTAPEPSQEAMTRSGTSTAPSASAAYVDYRRHHPPSFFSAARSLKKLSLDEVRRPVASGSSSRAANDDNDDSSRYPTPPSSAGSAGSPTGRAAAARGSGSGSGDGSGSGSVGGSGIGSGSGAAASGSGPGPGPRGDAAPLHPSNPFATTTSYARLDTHARHGDEISPPLSPQHHRSNCKPSASSRSSHHAPSQQHQLRTHRRHPSAPTPSGSWFDEPGPLPSHPHLHPPRPRDHHHRRNLSVASTTSGNSTSSNNNIKGNDDDNNTNTNTSTNLQRHRSLRQRYPGDMSHRPLDMLRADARAADRGPHQRHRKRISDTDTIDALDTIGGAYHHGGPYDATLTSRNLNAKYSPVAAVKASNEAALRATPRENIQDSLERHVPLQGTATIPAGARDMSGRIMDYEEGADLMREPDADGGAYKRWPGVQYHPDDYKGKGEPSFTIERDLKARKHGKHLSEADAFEMHPGVNRRAARQRSASNADQEGSASGNAYGGGGTGEGVRRSHSTGKKFSEGIKRRFGSLRHKKPAEVQ